MRKLFLKGKAMSTKNFHKRKSRNGNDQSMEKFNALWGKFVEAISVEVKKTSQADVARRLGVNPGQVSKWLSGLSDNASLKHFLAHLEALHIPLESLLPHNNKVTRAEEPDTAKIRHLRPHAQAETAYVVKGTPPPDGIGLIVPVYATAGAGAALERLEEEPLAQISIPIRYARAALFVVVVDGDSMEPTIRKGAYVGLDRDSCKIVQGEIYGVSLPYEGVVLKRVFLDHSNNTLILKSDNQAHPPFSVPIDGRDGLIVGRAVWVMQEV